MAIPTIKSTYTLDVETVRALEEMARRWDVSKSEALRRAIRAAAAEGRPLRADALEALDRLQRSLGLSPVRGRAWAAAVRPERQAAPALLRGLYDRGHRAPRGSVSRHGECRGLSSIRAGGLEDRRNLKACGCEARRRTSRVDTRLGGVL